MNAGKYVKELADACTEMFSEIGCMFEQEHLRLINMITAVGAVEQEEVAPSTPGAAGASWRTRSSRV